MNNTSFSRFYEKTIQERLTIIQTCCQLSQSERELFNRNSSQDIMIADRMSENVYSTWFLPLSIVPHFVINGEPYLIPFATEEASIVAAASNAAKLSTGFLASATNPIMIGQIQLVNGTDFSYAITQIKDRENELIEVANGCDPLLCSLGGGAQTIQRGKLLITSRGQMLIEELLLTSAMQWEPIL